MHKKSVVDGSSGRGLRGSDRPFVRLWNLVGKQRRFGAYTSPLWSPLFVRPLVLSCLILCWLLSLWSSILFSCLGFSDLSSSSVVSSCRVPCCLVFSSLGPSVLSLGASWKPLRRLWGDLLGLREPSGGLLGGLEASWVIPGPVPGRPWALLEGPWAALGGSWASLGPPRGALGGSWEAAQALLAPPGRLLEPAGRLQSRFLLKSRNSSTV